MNTQSTFKIGQRVSLAYNGKAIPGVCGTIKGHTHKGHGLLMGDPDNSAWPVVVWDRSPAAPVRCNPIAIV